MAITTAFPSGAPLLAAGNPVKLSGFDDPAVRPKAPGLDEHRAAILAELGRA
jgi:CoA:oxalate CoA-transferase